MDFAERFIQEKRLARRLSLDHQKMDLASFEIVLAFEIRVSTTKSSVLVVCVPWPRWRPLFYSGVWNVM